MTDISKLEFPSYRPTFLRRHIYHICLTIFFTYLIITFRFKIYNWYCNIIFMKFNFSYSFLLETESIAVMVKMGARFEHFYDNDRFLIFLPSIIDFFFVCVYKSYSAFSFLGFLYNFCLQSNSSKVKFDRFQLAYLCVRTFAPKITCLFFIVHNSIWSYYLTYLIRNIFLSQFEERNNYYKESISYLEYLDLEYTGLDINHGKSAEPGVNYQKAAISASPLVPMMNNVTVKYGAYDAINFTQIEGPIHVANSTFMNNRGINSITSFLFMYNFYVLLS